MDHIVDRRFVGIFNEIVIEGLSTKPERVMQYYTIKNVYKNDGVSFLHIEVKNPGSTIQVIVHQKGNDDSTEFVGITKEGVQAYFSFDKNFTRGMCGMSQTFVGKDKALTGKGYFLTQ